MKKSLYIFDLDGTLLDTINTIAYYCNAALKHFGFPENPVDSYRYFAGDGASMLLHRALAAHDLDTEENFQALYPYYIQIYNQDTTYLTAHFSGMPETLARLKENGIILGVVSNKPDSSVKYVIPKFFEDGLFSYIYGSGQNLPVKPDPYFVNEILRQTGIPKEQTLYIGDTATDMQTGKNAGLETAGVLWGFRDEKELITSGADHIIRKPAQLLNFLS